VAVVVLQVWHPSPFRPSLAGFVQQTAGSLAMPALAGAYASLIALGFLSPAGRKYLDWAGAIGRTALSNYLLQTVVATMLFYSYGLGLFGSMGPAVGLIPTFAIYAAQIPLSKEWLKRFRIGPMEWVWRSVTYGRFQPFRHARLVATTSG
jgi:uncharacterized protein